MAEDKSVDQRITNMTQDDELIAPKLVVRPEGIAPEEPNQFNATAGNVLDPMLEDKEVDAPISLVTTEAELEQKQKDARLDLPEEPVFLPEKEDVAINFQKFKIPSLKKLEEEQAKIKAGEKPPVSVFNPSTISTDSELASQIEALARADGLQKYKKISYKDFAQELNKAGYEYSEDFVNKMTDPKYLMDPDTKTIAEPYEVFKQFHFLGTIAKQAHELSKEVVSLKASGQLTPDKLAEFQHMVTLEGLLSRKLKKQQVELAQSLGILAEARKPGELKSQLLDEAFRQYDSTFGRGEKNVYKLAEKYANTPSADERTELAEVLMKPWYRRAMDIIPTVWLNGLISGIPTSMRNILGNATLGSMTKIENFFTVGWGKLLNTKERMYLKEAVVGMKTDFSYSKEAFNGFYLALMKNQLRDRMTKMDTLNPVGRGAFEYDMGPGHMKYVSKAIEYLGVASTVPGRLLQGEDEFIKTFTYWRSIRMQAARKQQQELQRLLDEGKSYDEALKRSTKLEEDLLANPDEMMVKEAIDFSRYSTNTQELNGWLRNVERLTNNPAMKLWMPFMRVSSNLIGAASERSLITAWATPRFWDNIRAGGVRRDTALARVTVGTMFMGTWFHQAMNGRMTGAGTMKWQDREALKKTGWQPYSLVFTKGELSPETIAKFKAITNVSEGKGINKDKIYISYQGLEPFSILAAQAATIAEYAKMSPKDGEMDELMMAGALSTIEYVSEHPLLAGMGKMVHAFTAPIGDDGAYLYNLVEEMVQEYSAYAINGVPTGPIPVSPFYINIDGKKQYVGGGWSGFYRNIEKALYPTRSESRQPLEMYDKSSTNPAMQGFNTALRKACAANPMCSEELPYAKDPITGADIKNGAGNMYDLWSPFKTSEGITPGAYNVITEFKANVPNVYFTYGSIDGVKLSSSQLNTLIYYATKGGKLDKAIVKLGKDLSKNNRISVDDKAKLVNEMITQFYSAAKDQLLANDRSLRMKIKEVQRAKEDAMNNGQSLNILLSD